MMFLEPRQSASWRRTPDLLFTRLAYAGASQQNRPSKDSGFRFTQNKTCDRQFILAQIELAGFWSRDGGSNPGPPVYKTVSLPLSYLGKPILRDPVNLR